MKQTFIASVETGVNTGGNILNDIITLTNGMIIRISGDSIGIYQNEAADEEGQTLSWVDMNTAETYNRNKFIGNSILRSESHTFPPDIDAGIERSNNPHGDYGLSVCADGDWLGTYYYDTREDAERDLEALQERFNVTDL